MEKQPKEIDTNRQEEFKKFVLKSDNFIRRLIENYYKKRKTT